MKNRTQVGIVTMITYAHFYILGYVPNIWRPHFLDGTTPVVEIAVLNIDNMSDIICYNIRGSSQLKGHFANQLTNIGLRLVNGWKMSKITNCWTYIACKCWCNIIRLLRNQGPSQRNFGVWRECSQHNLLATQMWYLWGEEGKSTKY